MSIEQKQSRAEVVPADHGTMPERFENPGIEPHRPRLGDEDPVAAKRSEWQVVLIFGISILATIGGVVGFYAFPVDEGVSLGGIRLSNLSLGLGLGVGMLGIGVGAIHWAKSLMSDVEQSEPREEQRSDEETRATIAGMLRDGARESNIARRPLLKGTLAGAVLLAPLTFLVPFIGGLGGDWNIDRFRRTAWAPRTNDAGGTEFVYLAHDPGGGRIRAADITEGSIVHVMPYELTENYEHYLDEKAKAVAILVRVDPRELTEPEDRQDWSYEGIVAYSKICTHVGCPVALYERQTHHVLCPCHQSTFDITDQAKVVFGPATRPLPQLPIAVDDEGYLYAADDFPEPIGPSFWERDRV
ncbi:cytochrome bc1 complex Rieske iron-sulfur subunit [Pseudactinotalea sp. Z1732]|uniref:cytochrome bc1 complex Rieske iron-sulfur subunit n=1 Tax=Micrococcales TaxID=85006 RepID=UPI003C7B902A